MPRPNALQQVAVGHHLVVHAGDGVAGAGSRVLGRAPLEEEDALPVLVGAEEEDVRPVLIGAPNVLQQVAVEHHLVVHAGDGVAGAGHRVLGRTPLEEEDARRWRRKTPAPSSSARLMPFDR
jgi:hypothetical protein